MSDRPTRQNTELEGKAMKTTAFRRNMKEEILELLEPEEWVLAVWEGGSAATGYLDDLSDLDLAMVVRDDSVERAFDILEDYLGGTYGISSRMRMPEPAWHGHSQCFYFINDAPELFYIDLLVEKESSGNRLLEPERHGTPVIWLDRSGILRACRATGEELGDKRRRFFESLSAFLPLIATEVRKQIERGKRIDAVTQHQRFVAGRLAGLLNLKYRPARFDFGIRYAERAYPEEVNRRLEELLYIPGFQEVGPAFQRAYSWALALLEELSENEGWSGGRSG